MQAKNRVLHIFKSVYGSGFELDAVVLWSRSVRPTLSFECTDGQRAGRIEDTFVQAFTGRYSQYSQGGEINC